MKNLSWMFVALLGIALAACTAESDNDGDNNSITITTDSEKDGKTTITIDSKNAERDLKVAMDEVQNALKDVNIEVNGEKVEVVNFRELQDLLPEKSNGFKRVSKEGETSGVMGFQISQAGAEYEDDDESFEIKLIDSGGMGAILKGMADWSEVKVDKEDDNGWERTYTKNGQKRYEKFKKNGESQIAMIINDRYILAAEGYKLSEKGFKRMRETVTDIKTSKLPGM
ncbi:MAG: hypothetical protein AB8F95_06585 [Bacteroidia bacterium]